MRLVVDSIRCLGITVKMSGNQPGPTAGKRGGGGTSMPRSVLTLAEAMEAQRLPSNATVSQVCSFRPRSEEAALFGKYGIDDTYKKSFTIPEACFALTVWLWTHENIKHTDAELIRSLLEVWNLPTLMTTTFASSEKQLDLLCYMLSQLSGNTESVDDERKYVEGIQTLNLNLSSCHLALQKIFRLRDHPVKAMEFIRKEISPGSAIQKEFGKLERDEPGYTSGVASDRSAAAIVFRQIIFPRAKKALREEAVTDKNFSDAVLINVLDALMVYVFRSWPSLKGKYPKFVGTVRDSTGGD